MDRIKGNGAAKDLPPLAVPLTVSRFPTFGSGGGAPERRQIQETGIRPDRLRGWRPIAQGTVRPDGVVLPPPLLDQHLRLRQVTRVFGVPVGVPWSAFGP